MQRYTRLSIFFHWLIAILIVAAFALGSVMTDMKISPTKLQYYSWHKWLGVTILGLVALRLLTRLFSGAPAHLDSLKKWEKQVASGTHALLYLLMFAVPLSGYFYTSAAGFPVVYLGLFELPTIIGPNPELKPLLKELHEMLTTVILVVVGLHVAAALKHHFIDKDGTMQRMLPGK
ncbi:MAG: cytochrome b [Undibacterium sp.]|uniref:cytochrome b n=1 Tax=Undibacterium sp. TaxID=1914977 RepID=UPI00271847AB|nr:cytochrome b [Undibacterium sp.]MDO8654061.1 cytochrome b [Undibacterium sp.]